MILYRERRVGEQRIYLFARRAPRVANLPGIKVPALFRNPFIIIVIIPNANTQRSFAHNVDAGVYMVSTRAQCVYYDIIIIIVYTTPRHDTTQYVAVKKRWTEKKNETKRNETTTSRVVFSR